MPIVVANQPNAASSIVGNYAAGQGVTRQKIAAEQRQAQERTRLAELDQTHALDRMDHEADLRREFAEEEQQRRYEDADWEYTTQQKREQEKLEEARAAVEAADYLTEDEKAQALYDIDQREAGIKPTRRIRKSGFPEGQGIGEIWTSDDGGLLLSRDRDGKVYKVGDTGQPTQKDRADLLKTVVSMMTPDENGNVDWNEAKRRMAEFGFPIDSNPDPTSGVNAPEVPPGPTETGSFQQQAEIEQSKAKSQAEVAGLQSELEEVEGSAEAATTMPFSGTMSVNAINDIASAKQQLKIAETDIRLAEKSSDKSGLKALKTRRQEIKARLDKLNARRDILRTRILAAEARK